MPTCKIIVKLKPLTYSEARPALTVDEIDSIEDAYWITIKSILRTTYSYRDYDLELAWAADGIETRIWLETELLTQELADTMLVHIQQVVWDIETQYLRWFSSHS